MNDNPWRPEVMWVGIGFLFGLMLASLMFLTSPKQGHWDCEPNSGLKDGYMICEVKK